MYINFPTGDNLTAVIQGFQSKWNIPQCAGSIDGTHIPITPPAMNYTDYCIGWPGSVHDARVFSNSMLYSKVNNSELLLGHELAV